MNPDVEVFNAIRQQYDGLTTRALSDAVIQRSAGTQKTHFLAVASGLCITGFNDNRAPVSFALEWLPEAKVWWPVSLACSHPSYVPVF